MAKKTLAHCQNLVAEILQKFGPLPGDDVARRINAKPSTACSYLRLARKAGAVDRTGLGALVIWFAPADEERAREIVRKQKEKTRAGKLARARQRYTWEGRKARVEKAHDAWAQAKPVQRIVRASEAPPIKISGPASVFAFGSMGA